MILCASCNTPLWEVKFRSGMHPVFCPATPEVPPFDNTIAQCPFCGQEIQIRLRSKLDVFLYRDDEDGRLGTLERRFG